MRVLDEVAEAVRRARGFQQRPCISLFGLEAQFDRPITAREWSVIDRYLVCSLPPLEFIQGHWFLPASFSTVWDLVDHAALVHPDWEQPVERTDAAWREAQIFTGVRACLADAGSLDESQIHRTSHLREDLGF